jgi:hypothetical protein
MAQSGTPERGPPHRQPGQQHRLDSNPTLAEGTEKRTRFLFSIKKEEREPKEPSPPPKEPDAGNEGDSGQSFRKSSGLKPTSIAPRLPILRPSGGHRRSRSTGAGESDRVTKVCSNLVSAKRLFTSLTITKEKSPKPPEESDGSSKPTDAEKENKTRKVSKDKPPDKEKDDSEGSSSDDSDADEIQEARNRAGSVYLYQQSTGILIPCLFFFFSMVNNTK